MSFFNRPQPRRLPGTTTNVTPAQPLHVTGVPPLSGNPLMPRVTSGMVQPTPGSGLVVPLGEPERGYRLKVEARQEPVVGWRRYDLHFVRKEDGEETLVLQGARMPWHEASFTAVCMNDMDTTIFQTLRDMFGQRGVDVYKAYADKRAGLYPSPAEVCEQHIRDGFCQCGIYGGAYPGNTMGGGPVIAKCLAWGYVAVDDAGNWKASAARIEAIFVVKGVFAMGPWMDWPKLTAALRTRYECPVFLVEELDEIPR